MKFLSLLMFMSLLSGCSVFGNSNVEEAPYELVKLDSDHGIEIRHYNQLVLVSAAMDGDESSDKKTPFHKLLKYISGNNTTNATSSMTTPVLLMSSSDGNGIKIPMTAPVFMDIQDDQGSMSFVLPESYTIDSAPRPNDSMLLLKEIRDINYAVIQFKGFLDSENIKNHRKKLEQWIDEEGIEVIGGYKVAGYNPPFTIPFFRRNEILIPVKI